MAVLHGFHCLGFISDLPNPLLKGGEKFPPPFYSKGESEGVAHAIATYQISLDRLLVKAVAGGASKGSGKNKQHLLRAFSPNK
jgi:hypothetical protein